MFGDLAERRVFSTVRSTTATINMKEGENWTCTYLNHQQPGSLQLVKKVVNDNGGTAAESAWTLTATGNPVTSPASFSGAGAAGNADVLSPATLDAGSYDLSESAGPAGYRPGTWSCTGGQTGTQAKGDGRPRR